MEDKLKDTKNAGMISMYGRGTFSDKNKEDLSNDENEFLSDSPIFMGIQNLLLQKLGEKSWNQMKTAFTCSYATK